MTCPHPNDRTAIRAPTGFRVRKCRHCGGWRLRRRHVSKQKAAAS